MKFHVREEVCVGCGMCTGVCPQVFSMGDAGTAVAVETEVSTEDFADAKDAMSSCPVGAIEEV